MLNWMQVNVPVGGGKSKLIAAMVEEIRKKNPGMNIIHLSHYAPIREQFLREVKPGKDLFATTPSSFLLNYQAQRGDVIIMDDMDTASVTTMLTKMFNKPVYGIEVKSGARS